MPLVDKIIQDIKVAVVKMQVQESERIGTAVSVGDILRKVEAIEPIILAITKLDLYYSEELNKKTIPNPVPVELIERIINWDDMMRLLKPEQSIIINNIIKLYEAVQLNDKEAASKSLRDLVIDRTILDTDEVAITKWMQEKIEDPNYKPLLSWSEVYIDRIMSYTDIMESKVLKLSEAEIIAIESKLNP